MSACSITLKGIDFSCKDSVGGIKQVWLAPWREDGFGEPNEGVIDLQEFSSTDFKKYRFRVGNGSMNTTLNADEANGTVFASTELNMKFTKLSVETRAEIAEILKGNVAAIVEDNKGTKWALGVEHPLTLTAGTVATGATMSDFAGYDITLTDTCSTLPYQFDDDSFVG